MSIKYKHGDKVPSDVLCKRLDELSSAVTRCKEGMREFDMRIPAERDRDADLVLMLASKRIKELEEVAIKSYALIEELHDSGCLDDQRLEISKSFCVDAIVNSIELNHE